VLVLLVFVVVGLAALALSSAYRLWRWIPSPMAQRRSLALAARIYERAGARPLRPGDLGTEEPYPGSRGLGADLAAELWLDAAAAGDALLPVAEALHAWSTVDDDVYQAVEHLSHEHIEGFHDLLTVMSRYQLDTPGLFYKLRGHVGEWQAIHHLADLAPAVPLDAANPAYDMLLGGNPVNVKVVGDATRVIREHFAQHPDVPLILNADAAHLPADALHFDPSHLFDPAVLEHTDHLVIVDDALTAADAGGAAQHALGTVDHPAGGFHFPWITLAVSTVVESRLLARGQTLWTRAAKNTAVRAGAVGAGAAIGKLIGGAVGSMLGPFGTASGTLAGGVAGSFAGRLVARTAIGAPLRAAREAYRRARAAFDAQVERARQDADETWAREVLVVQSEYDEQLVALSARQRDALALTRENNAVRSQAVVTPLRVQVEMVHHRLRALRERLRPLTERVPLLRAITAPVTAWEARLAAIPDDAALVLLLGAVPAQQRDFVRFVAALAAARAAYLGELERVQTVGATAARELRARAVAELKQRWAAMEEQIAGMTAESGANMADAAQAYRTELRRAGKPA
jgi:hypothetical protein